MAKLALLTLVMFSFCACGTNGGTSPKENAVQPNGSQGFFGSSSNWDLGNNRLSVVQEEMQEYAIGSLGVVFTPTALSIRSNFNFFLSSTGQDEGGGTAPLYNSYFIVGNQILADGNALSSAIKGTVVGTIAFTNAGFTLEFNGGNSNQVCDGSTCGVVTGALQSDGTLAISMKFPETFYGHQIVDSYEGILTGGATKPAASTSSLAECGLGENNIAERIKDCNALPGSGDQKNWALVARRAIKGPEQRVVEVWEDLKSGLIWGDLLSEQMNFADATAACRSASSVMTNAGISEVAFDLPTMDDILSANNNLVPGGVYTGWSLPIPNATDVQFWTSTMTGSKATLMTGNNDGFEGGWTEDVSVPHFVRCIARAGSAFVR